MNAALLTYEQDEQAGYYQTAIKILNEESPNVWLFDRQNLVAVNTGKLENSVWGPGHIMWLNNAQTWSVVE
jgi:ABC-type transport system substrate-binding protein